NHFVLGFVPFGVSFNEFISLFAAEMKLLEREKIMDVQGNKSFIIASIGDITSDLPQENDLVGVKRHNAAK
ncbi:11157_t:CDS:1, partial [Racocetra fulgida]